MKTLDELIDDIAKRGNLSHISIVAREGEFYAFYAPAASYGYVSGNGKTPSAALRAALAAKPAAKAAPHPAVDEEVDPLS